MFRANRIASSLAAAAILALAAAPVQAQETSIRTAAIVKVYSNGQLVETYEAVNEGRMEGDCFVFRVRRGAREPEVRVCGTFSVENRR